MASLRFDTAHNAKTTGVIEIVGPKPKKLQSEELAQWRLLSW
jgi:hypothetical protein